MKRLIRRGILVTGLATAALTSAAEITLPGSDEQAAIAVDVRQSAMKMIGWNMGPLGGMLRNPTDFDATIAERNGRRIHQLSLMLSESFSVDTSGSSVSSGSLPAIWGRWEDFQSNVTALIDASEALASAAAGGDQGDTLGALGRMGQSCGGCHDTYRQD